MKKVGKIHLLIAIIASVLLIVQAIVGIMMYTNGSETQEMTGQKMIESTVDRSTTSDATEDSAKEESTTDSTENSTATTDESTTVPSQGQQGIMGTPPQGGPNGSGAPGELPSGGGFQGRDSFSFKVIDFYQGIGGLATSIIVLIIGGSGLVTSVMSRKNIM